MLLVIDVGNTNMEFGVYRGEALVGSFRLMTDANRTSDELGLWLCQYFQRFGLELGQVEDVVIGSVAPQVMHTLSRAVQKYVGKTPLVLDEALDPGLPYVECDSDERLGPDRAAADIAAIAKYGAPLVVLDFGTATTFCALTPEGEYLGGAIAPGIGISTEALFQKAAKMPRIELIKPPKAICRDTIHAMRSGVIFGFVGQMDGLISRMKKELGGQAFVVATGGFGKLMASESDQVDVVEPFLTLEGLRILHEMNR